MNWKIKIELISNVIQNYLFVYRKINSYSKSSLPSISACHIIKISLTYAHFTEVLCSVLDEVVRFVRNNGGDEVVDERPQLRVHIDIDLVAILQAQSALLKFV